MIKQKLTLIRRRLRAITDHFNANATQFEEIRQFVLVTLDSILTPLNKDAREIKLARRPGDLTGDEWRVGSIELNRVDH